MRNVLDRLKHKGVNALVSNSDTPAVHALYTGFPITVIEAPRKVSAKTSGRGKTTEVIIRSKK